MKRILVVDDTDSILDLIQKILESEGYLALTASNGVEGLEALGDNLPFDLVITDKDMPQMGGIEMVKNMRKTNNDVAIIAMSGNWYVKEKDAYRSLGVTDFLDKSSLHVTVLLSLVESILARKVG